MESVYAAFDPVAIRAWGPFNSNREAMAFIEADKYRESFCVVWTREDCAKHNVSLHHPTAYDPAFEGGLKPK